MHLLVTRPAAQAKHTCKNLERDGHTCIIDAMLRVENLESPLPGGSFDGIIVTSANAIDTLDRLWPQDNRSDIPVFTTGSTTAEIARNAGFENRFPVQGSAPKLVMSLVTWLQDNEMSCDPHFLYPCAETLAYDVKDSLSAHKVRCTNWPVYRTVEADSFSAETKASLTGQELDGVLLYSARTAKNFASLLDDSTDCPPLFVLSDEIKQALPQNLRKFARYPLETSEEAMRALLRNKIK